jgi:hypothetical protein
MNALDLSPSSTPWRLLAFHPGMSALRIEVPEWPIGTRAPVERLDLSFPPAPAPMDRPAVDVPVLAPRLTGDRVVDHYVPKTELGKRLVALRRAYIEGGGRLMDWEEIEAEVRSRRGGAEAAAGGGAGG